MSNSQESIGRTLTVALLVCLVCSVVVAGAAVGLKPTQVVNRQLDKQRNILMIAGLADAATPDGEVKRIFDTRIKPRVVELDSGRYSETQNPETFDPLVAAKDPAQSRALSADEDIASIRRRENYSVVYLVEDAAGKTETLILPVRGYGLWSTLYGFIALKSDYNTIAGFGFYQHGETPGLGGEVDNPRWKALWQGKQILDAQGALDINVIKGTVDPASPRALHQVDGLAGATLTSNGVNNLLHFWLGQQGFEPLLAHLRAGEI
ncbi:Na(+)-translocating NADH-quinone reductase subunit C [Lysobacteraceae bacterium NML120232]|nr:Na(+)-translocating NADH-quinone reductase subunit C [Xanthomonadaceae bacterium NML08-0793]PJK13493.1 Na(+)-translocating NADH-quinone reductase subunit C [Xanthomonadaceae bacterium NML120232]